MGNSKLKYTTEEFISIVKEKHNNRYDYPETIYGGSLEKVTVCCKAHGNFSLRASCHLDGQGCRKCGNEKSTIEEVIEKAIKVHGDKYDYSKSTFTKMKVKAIIICPIHGEFLQDFATHIDKKAGCPKCGKIRHNARIREKYTENVIEMLIAAHGDKYDYSKVEYINNKTKVTIICKTHGDFLQTTLNHLQGQGCPQCGKESHWRRSDYIKKAKGRVCIFYTIRCFNEDEEFYKIGITMQGVKGRYKDKRDMPYEYEVISEVKGSAGFIWDLERDEKRKLKILHYKPTLDFAGSVTECFTNYKI
mgnify:FL=1